ncbi:CRISPR-associated endonuclease Cas3'' [Thermococcus waiotapuensis]|uniref:CRISPR-associated endonuclease Cas3 n=1 Tax=Thermococcus waiotapuensis TaxID=90909 RepID=A0AAE4NWP4_9EURY|nr:CRISPR-associated endonuclease Cas3'' [Thermococcus waiotapuensis]MDV3104584.1 CRISPR-associated endonuclease Cas3'' [Thermococcus waiotapuensis]
MSPCAYFKNGECVETMEAHLKRGLELLEGLYIGRNYGKFLGRLLGVEPKAAEELLRKAYILHDVGKCLETFQTRREGFGYHEFYSYLLAKNALAEFSTAGKIAAVAILLHHHDWIRDRTAKKPQSLRLTDECIQLLEELSGTSIPREIPWGEPIEEYKIAEEILRKSLRGVYALLLPIVMADNYAAACNRGGNGSMLGEEITEVLKVRRWGHVGHLPRGL